MAPRGIVAASVATVFFSQTLLIEEGAGEVPELVPVVLATVIVTVALHELTAIYVARKIRGAKIHPNGVALVSNNRFAVDLADQLVLQEIPVLVISTSTTVQREAFSRGLLAHDRSIDSHDLDLTLDGPRESTYFQVQPDEDNDDFEMCGRSVFGDLTFHGLSSGARAGGFHVVTGQTEDTALFELGEKHSVHGAVSEDTTAIAVTPGAVQRRRNSNM